MFERLDAIQEKYEELTKELSSPEVLGDYNKLKKLSKEQKDLEETTIKYNEYKKVVSNLEEAEMLVDDPEMGEMAKLEIEELSTKKEELIKELEILLIPKDENDDKDIIMEIRGAAGGDEANIFAGDLFRMYSRYADKNGWKLEVINSEPGTAGGFSQIEAKIKGEKVYSKLKYESGSHRVQRIPVTESNGRIQTSTATVLIMPEVEDVDIEINPNDLRIDVYCATGHGGQGVNTTPSAVRITHLPTNTVVTCQNERSQLQNKAQAMEVLKARLYQMAQEEQDAAVGNERRSKIGTGDRAEKIRTYNYPQNRVTDHRIGFTVNTLDRVMDGDLDAIIEALITEDLQRKLKGE
ncbi:MAG: peptide chain release factor 1 [Bacilli bacterium]|jgi:peptide chain release factor 1|nr:peptide chain release factor 1 [Bacilli bacterium]